MVASVFNELQSIQARGVGVCLVSAGGVAEPDHSMIFPRVRRASCSAGHRPMIPAPMTTVWAVSLMLLSSL